MSGARSSRWSWGCASLLLLPSSTTNASSRYIRGNDSWNLALFVDLFPSVRCPHSCPVSCVVVGCTSSSLSVLMAVEAFKEAGKCRSNWNKMGSRPIWRGWKRGIRKITEGKREIKKGSVDPSQSRYIVCMEKNKNRPRGTDSSGTASYAHCTYPCPLRREHSWRSVPQRSYPWPS